MQSRDGANHAPYAPASGIIMPIVSIVLSLPTIGVGAFLFAASMYQLLVGHSFYTGTPRAIQVPVPFCLALVFGPMLAAVLCTSQRTRAEHTYGSDLLLGYRIKRLNRIALWCAALGIVMLPALFVMNVVLLSLHPQ